MSRLPFFQGAGHLVGTKHSKAWVDYGYAIALDFYYFYAMYRRVGLAKAGIERPVDVCWLTNPNVKRGDKDDGEILPEFEEFTERLNLWPALKQLDYMQRVGHYAGLFIRVADGQMPNTPLDSTSMDKITEFTPCWEGQLIPGNLETNPKSPRYGLPIEYTYQQQGVTQQGQRDGNESITIHHSRILIWNEGAAGNTIYGESAMEAPYNALVDWEKIRGAGGEGFWRQAALRGVLQANADTSGQAPSDEEMELLTETISDMQKSFDAIPYLGGMELNTLQTKIDRPDGFKDIALEDVAAGFKWSAKGLIGAQEGRLAGDQDSGLDKQTAQSRRENFISLMIKKLLKWLNDYTEFDNKLCFVEWDDLMSPSDKDRLENASKMADINYKTWQATGQTVYEVDEMREMTLFDALASPLIDERTLMEDDTDTGIDTEESTNVPTNK